MALRGRGGDFGGTEHGLTLLVLDRFAIERLFLPGGTAYGWGRELGFEVAVVAQAELYPGHGYITGELQRSVGSSVVPVGPQMFQVNVRATARHAAFYIQGTRAHPISSSRTITVQSGKSKGQRQQGWMKFFWMKAGKTVYAQQVWHPEWAGNNFLDTAKNAVLARRGITRG